MVGIVRRTLVARRDTKFVLRHIRRLKICKSPFSKVHSVVMPLIIANRSVLSRSAGSFYDSSVSPPLVSFSTRRLHSKSRQTFPFALYARAHYYITTWYVYHPSNKIWVHVCIVILTYKHTSSSHVRTVNCMS